MAYPTDMIVDHLACPVCHTQWLVLGQGMPWCEGEAFTKPVLFRGIEHLPGNMKGGHLVEGGIGFLPLRHGVFDLHPG